MKDGMLEFSDWPMFDLLMTDKELCREVIEIILDESIADIEYIVTEDDVRPTLTNHQSRRPPRCLREDEKRDLRY